MQAKSRTSLGVYLMNLCLCEARQAVQQVTDEGGMLQQQQAVGVGQAEQDS